MFMPVNIRETTVNDAPAVFSFFLAQGKVREEENKLWLKRWRLLFELNPWLAGAVHHPLGWVIEGEDGTIKGYAGNIILSYTYGGVVCKAACTTGVVVDPAYRRYSMSMLKGYFTQIGIDIFISSTANKVSGTILEALKIPKFPVENYNVMYYFLINPSKIVYSFLQQRLPVFFARPLALFIGITLTVWFYLQDAVFVNKDKAAKGWKIVEKSLEDLDDTYDSFWKLVVNQNDQLMFLRTRESLQWHFAGAGNWSAPTLFCYYEKDQMLGYALIDKHFEQDSGMLRFRCADLLTFGDKKEIIKRLIVTAYVYAKKERADLFLCYFLPWPVRKVVNRLAHLRRKRSGGVYIRTLNAKLSGINVMQKWYATCADGDSAFWNLTAPRL